LTSRLPEEARESGGSIRRDSDNRSRISSVRKTRNGN
jgi:hypothetical protein